VDRRPNNSGARARRVGALAVAAAVALVVAGCGGSSSNTNASTTTSSSGAAAATSAAISSTSAAETTVSSSAAAATASGGTTPPGTKLALGAPALVNYQQPGEEHGPKYRLQVSVLGIRQGSKVELDGVELEKAQQNETPYYVTMKITNVGPGDAAAHEGDPMVGFQATDDRGQAGQELTILGKFRPCESVTTPKHFTQGVTQQTCVIYMVGSGGSIVNEQWTGSGSDQYTENPIVWSAG
jgi:hypothetical protein